MNTLKKFLAVCMLASLTFSATSCVYLVVGGVGALGGYVVSPDTVEGLLADKDQEEVWDAAEEVVSVMGIISEKTAPGGLIVAKIQGTKVTVTIFQMSKSTVRLTVKARKAFFPRIKVAQDVYVKIVDALNE